MNAECSTILSSQFAPSACGGLSPGRPFAAHDAAIVLTAAHKVKRLAALERTPPLPYKSELSPTSRSGGIGRRAELQESLGSAHFILSAERGPVRKL